MNAEIPHPSIRRATISDATHLAAFAAEVFPLACPETAPEDLEAFIGTELASARFESFIADPNLIVLVAETFIPERRLAGYMVVARRNPHPSLDAPNAAEFRKLYVSPAFHGTGLASALVHCALSILSAESPRPIWLSVFSENARAIAFYKKWGFEIAGEQFFVVGTDPQRDFLMLRPSAAVARE